MILQRPKIFLAIFILLTVLVFTGCQNPFAKEKPEKVVADMLAKLSTLESVAFNSVISINEEGSNKITNVKIEGETDFFRQDQPVADITLAIGSQSDQEFKLKGQVKLVARELYLKIEEFSDQETMAELGIKQNEWYAVGIGDQLGLSAEQKRKVRALISQVNFVKVEETLPKEEISGQEYYHYRISFSAAKAEKFLIDPGKIIGDSSVADLVKGYFAPAASRTYEIWIGKDDHWPKRIAAQNVASDETIKTKTNISLILELNRFNEQFDITIPEKIEELKLEELPMFDGSQIYDSGDLKKDTDQDGLSDFVESIYQTDPNNPDSDKDGFLDGEEVEHGYNPLGAGEFNPVSF